MGFETTNHYQHSKYQRVAELDSWLADGISIDERYEREADFALRASALHINPNDHILDLASGAGGHARRISTLTNANIDARDISKTLIDIAQEKEVAENIVDPTRKAIDHRVGDMTDVGKLSIPEQRKYILITVLGSSFAFLHTREKYIETLKNLRSLLKNGGKMVVQFRVYNPECIKSLQAGGQHPQSVKKAPRQKNPVVVTENEEGITVFRDTKNGDEFYMDYNFSPELYDPSLSPVRNDQGEVIDILNALGTSLVLRRLDNGTVGVYRAPDGIPHVSFDRIYVDRNGEKTRLGVNHFDLFSFERKGLETLQRFFSEAGFKNVELKSEVLSPESDVYQVAVVGEK